MKNERFKGIFTAIVTPFKNGSIDLESLERLVKEQVKCGVDGFVVNGTTGESPTLSQKEIELAYDCIRKIVGPNIPLIVGAGGNNTQAVIDSAKAAEALGADAILSVVPYYNKPPQRGLVAHFSAVANSIHIPTILYNVPGRTITSLSAESIAELSKNKKIIGIKEASGNIDFAKEIIRLAGPEFIMLSGDDETYVAFLEAGGHGVISVATHIIPTQMKRWKNLVKDGKSTLAKEEISTFTPLIRLLFSEANPIPVKAAVKELGLIDSGELRLPLLDMDPELLKKLKAELVARGITK